MAQTHDPKMVEMETREDAAVRQWTAKRPLLLTARETAERLGITTVELGRRRRRNEAPASTKLAGNTMYYYLSVEASLVA